MQQCIETPNEALWPFGSDKRMLYAIYAHFNTMIQKHTKVNIPTPVLQKLNTICSEMKSLLQIITGMQLKTQKLDFELSALFKEMDECIKCPQNCRKHNRVSNKKAKKRERQRSRSRSHKASIYQCKHSDAFSPSMSKHELNSFVIDDYIQNVPHSEASNAAKLRNKMDLITIGKKKTVKKAERVKPNRLLTINHRTKSKSVVAPQISTTIQYESPSFSAIILNPTPSSYTDLDAGLQSYRSTEPIVSSFASSISSIIGIGSTYNPSINILTPSNVPTELNKTVPAANKKKKSRRTKTCDLSRSNVFDGAIKWKPITPPLPAKCRKSVALEVMHRSKIQRRQRPLPIIIDII